MKRLWTLLAIGFALTLSACGGQGGQEQAAEETAATPAVDEKTKKTFEETQKAFLEHAMDILEGKKYIPPSSGEAKAKEEKQGE